MIFSRIGRSLSRFSFQRNVISGNYAERAVLANESLSSSTSNACFSGADGGLGLVRGYVTSVGAGKQLVSDSYLSNFRSVLANPSARRFFSSQAPKKKNYENYYPKDKKEIPKANEQKSESKGDSNTGDHGNSQENLVKQFQNLIAPLLFLAFIFSPIFVSPHDQKQVIVFQYSFSSQFIGF